MNWFNKQVMPRDEAAVQDPPGLDLIRMVAGEAITQTQFGGFMDQHRLIQIHRDGAGNVIGSTEVIEQTAHVDFNVLWNK